MARKFFALVITGIFLCNLCGYYFIFLTDQAFYRHEMKNLIRAGKLGNAYETLVFNDLSSLKEIHWIDAKEFHFRGKLYDVVNVARYIGKTVIVCINDTKEEQLVSGYRHYENLLAGNQSQGRSRHNQALSQLIVKHALCRTVSLPPSSPPSLLAFIFRDSLYRSVPLVTFSPPPELS